jgi:LysR family hydrogen peroxide-inducible transcriptional activator
MEMHQVRYFLAVAQELNFSRAAEKCNVSQPSLSRAIQQLEGELGGPLFHRERHLTHLTDLGEMVRPHLETVFAAAVKVKHLSKDLSQLKRVPLKLGIMSQYHRARLLILLGRSRYGTTVLNYGSVMQTPRT